MISERCCAPEVKPGQRPGQAVAGFSLLSRSLSGAPLQVSSPAEVDPTAPSHFLAAAGHDRAYRAKTKLLFKTLYKIFTLYLTSILALKRH